MIIIGAGLAGLSAAYELTELGHEVTVFEARMRPGGRVHTLRDAFPDGLYAEAGAARIGNHHDFTLKYTEIRCCLTLHALKGEFTLQVNILQCGLTAGCRAHSNRAIA